MLAFVARSQSRVAVSTIALSQLKSQIRPMITTDNKWASTMQVVSVPLSWPSVTVSSRSLECSSLYMLETKIYKLSSVTWVKIVSQSKLDTTYCFSSPALVLCAHLCIASELLSRRYAAIDRFPNLFLFVYGNHR